VLDSKEAVVSGDVDHMQVSNDDIIAGVERLQLVTAGEEEPNNRFAVLLRELREILDYWYFI
jgi:hypothetical protein